MPTNIIFIVLSLFIYFISTFLSSLEINPFYRLYYIFAWYSYIFFIDGVIYSIKNNSLIISRTKEFVYMLVVSSGLWFLFEIFNISLKNWSYIMLPYDASLRYFGYIVSYATVLPAIFETTEFIETALKNEKLEKIKLAEIKNLKTNKMIYSGLIITGITLITAKYLFPLIWAAPILITEGLNLKLGTRSLIRELSGGNLKKIISVGIAGLICGFLWEFFNYRAGAKWTYHLPYLNSPKLFEMPAAGYIGFVFFAFECYSIYNLLSYFKKGISWEMDTQTPLFKKEYPYYLPILILIVSIISVISINLIDKFTVKSFTIF